MPVPDDPPEFAAVWDAYPNKRGKAAALKVWQRIGSPELARVVVHAIAWQRREAEWLRDSGRFIPRLSTYLNQRRWEDEPSPVQPAFATPQTAGNAQALAEALHAIDRGEVR